MTLRVGGDYTPGAGRPVAMESFTWKTGGLCASSRHAPSPGARKVRGPLTAESRRMNAARAYDLFDLSPDALPTPPALVVPSELRALFVESARMKASFYRLPERDRRGFVRYVEETRSVMTRERRAAVVAMSLMGLARDLRDDGTSSGS